MQVGISHTTAFRYQPWVRIADQLMAARVIKRAPTNVILEEQLMREKKVKVKVIDRWSVVHDGKRHVKGDELTVPEDVADEWERNHWVERVSSKS